MATRGVNEHIDTNPGFIKPWTVVESDNGFATSFNQEGWGG
jgi:hypothetical protein